MANMFLFVTRISLVHALRMTLPEGARERGG